MKRLFTIILFCFSTCAFCQNIRYGTTVITHGFQPPGFAAPIEDGDWAYEMAEAILDRIEGNGCIGVYQKESGEFEIEKGNCKSGEVVLLYDWAAESKLDTKGYSEAAGDALFVSLMKGQKKGDFSLNRMHFIGHSRGCVVNTEAIERLLHVKQTYAIYQSKISIDQVTNLDPHDWGGGSGNFVTDQDNHPNIDIPCPSNRRPNNGVIAWKGSGFNDSYFQTGNSTVGSAVILDGRPVNGTFNVDWSEEAPGHSEIHKLYTQTIQSPFLHDHGYKYSRLVGSTRSREDAFCGTQMIKHEPNFDFYKQISISGNSKGRIRGIMNGSFDRGNRTFSSIPGWEYHGGNFESASLRPNFILLSKNASSPSFIKHNRFFIPPDAKKILFRKRVFNAGLGINNAVLAITINGDTLPGGLEIESSGGWTEHSVDVSNYQNQVVTLKFELSYPNTPANPIEVGIDDVEFGKTETQSLPSLFLFDLSGSMAQAGASGQPKIKEAEEAAKKSLETIRNNADQGIAQSVSIRTFSGGCPSPGTDPSRQVIEFTEDLDRIEAIIDAIDSPGGGTPLKEAIEASEAILSKHIKDNNLPKGRLIILSDGQATCGSIRPNDVYAFGQSGKVERSIQGLRSAGAGASPIKYYTIGFNIAPGSEAERDLKYLASISGGKYLNAQNQFQLTRAFQRFSQVFVPKPAPMQTGLPGTSTGVFNEGVQNIRDEYYRDALQQFKSFHQLHDQDCHGAYNLAVAYEANEYYKASMQQYENYLQLCPDASDRRKVQEKIKLLQKDYEAFLEFSKKVIESDRDYLKLHFKKIQNGESIALATEFIAFIKEKWRYYEKLPEILEMDSRMLEINAEAVFRGLKECASTIDRDPQNWDRNATPVLSRTYLNMDRLLKSF